MKILLVGHRYNIEDRFIGAPVIEYLQELGTVPVLTNITDREKAAGMAHRITETLPWAFNRELVGSVAMYKKR